MADIILAGENFSLKKLRNAAEQLEDAQNLIQKVYDAVFGTGFWAETDSFALLSGNTNMNVFDGTIDELHTYQQRVYQKEETLRTLAQRIEAAVQEIAETDQFFSGKLSGESGKTTWERIGGAVRSVGQTVSAAAVSLIGAINGLFSSDGTVAGEIKINGFTQEQIANAYLQFDWTDLDISDGDIKEVIAGVSCEAELFNAFQSLNEKKKELHAVYVEYKDVYYLSDDELKQIIIDAANASDARETIESKNPVIYTNSDNYTNKRRWEDITPPKKNEEGKRHSKAYREVLDALEVESNPRYARENGNTWCNIYVTDATASMGCEIPHWYNGHELNADGMIEWLNGTAGSEAGWIKCDASKALEMANSGYPTVATCSGHVAMVAPQDQGDDIMYLSQAGGRYKAYDGNNRKIPANYVFYGHAVSYYYHL